MEGTEPGTPSPLTPLRGIRIERKFPRRSSSPRPTAAGGRSGQAMDGKGTGRERRISFQCPPPESTADTASNDASNPVADDGWDPFWEESVAKWRQTRTVSGESNAQTDVSRLPALKPVKASPKSSTNTSNLRHRARAATRNGLQSMGRSPQRTLPPPASVSNASAERNSSGGRRARWPRACGPKWDDSEASPGFDHTVSDATARQEEIKRQSTSSTAANFTAYVHRALERQGHELDKRLKQAELQQASHHQSEVAKIVQAHDDETRTRSERMRKEVHERLDKDLTEVLAQQEQVLEGRIKVAKQQNTMRFLKMHDRHLKQLKQQVAEMTADRERRTRQYRKQNHQDCMETMLIKMKERYQYLRQDIAHRSMIEHAELLARKLPLDIQQNTLAMEAHLLEESERNCSANETGKHVGQEKAPPKDV